MDDIEKLTLARKSLPNLINDTFPLNRDDYFKIGLFIQSYCVADLEARRIVNLLEQIQSGNPTSYASKLNDKDAIEHLKNHAAKCVWNEKVSDGLGKAAEILSMHRKIRHMLAHWSGRRINGHDAYIFFTANIAGQKIPDGSPMLERSDNANMQYGVMPVSDLDRELEKLKGHVEYMSRIGGQLEAKVSEIAQQFSEDRRQGKL